MNLLEHKYETAKYGGSVNRHPPGGIRWRIAQQGEQNRAQFHNGGAAAFTIMEAVISVAIMGIFVAAAVAALVTDQICSRKAKEQAIGMDFLTKYVENIKALPFNSIAAGLPINSIYNGAGGAPLITIPSNNVWVPLSTINYQMFYPDLLWLTNRNPTMLVNLTQNTVGGALHDIEINAKIDWNAPLAAGGRLEVDVDVLRTIDVPTL